VFDRIAVISSDEPAMRLTRTVRQHNAAHGSRTRVIAPRTEAEWRATFVRAGDEAVLLRETGAGDPYLGRGKLPRPVAAACGRRSWAK
jgi:acetyl/propionyl-CoA carboxylase alpha subunit